MMTMSTQFHNEPDQILMTAWHEHAIPVAPWSSETFISAAAAAAKHLPLPLEDALAALSVTSPAAGALLVRGLPVGKIPTTPSSPTTPVDKDLVSEFTLLTVARRLGEPVGYLPEHGGDIIQNIVPTANSAVRQVSTSSKVELLFHTEAAFHPHRPRYLLLLCLRGDMAARTTLSSAVTVLATMDDAVVTTLFEPRFRTAVDESYLHGRTNLLGPPMPVLGGTRERPTMIFDADLMVGVDPAADEALQALAAATTAHHTAVVLGAGDLLIVDNTVAVHGRSPFTPRFDGTDRWLQRAFVVADLEASASERRGRTIVTRFGGHQPVGLSSRRSRLS